MASPEAASVVERVKDQTERSWRNGITAVRQDDLEALLAVVEAAKAFDAESKTGPPYSKGRALRIRQLRQRMHESLDALSTPE